MQKNVELQMTKSIFVIGIEDNLAVQRLGARLNKSLRKAIM